jgi:S-adenosylmethionine:tRNA ribosyltransferase-isomerase
VYARLPGSVAAPTAGLHLTPEVLGALADRGITVAAVELVVGLDTFKPVTAVDPAEHEMHSERYRVPPETLDACHRAKRVVAIGTTTVRALESAAATGAPSGRTTLFIRRPFAWQVVDVLLTNFHLPRTTLLMMIDAFIGPRWRELYATALADDYRFLSFGDAMLLQRAS